MVASRKIASILWIGAWAGDKGISSSRYFALLHRFSAIKQIRYPYFRGVGRLESIFLPHLIRILSYYYRFLFDPGGRLLKWWNGEVIVDIDDPTFSTEEIERLNDSRVRVIVTTTEQLRELFIKYGVKRPIKVIPSGFNKRYLNQRMVEWIKERFNPQGNPVVGYISPYLRIQPNPPDQNDISLLLEAMEIVWKHEPHVYLWLIGHASKELRELALKEPRIKLIGLVSKKNLLNFVKNFDIGTYPRKVDHGGRFSVKLIEYMGCGVPIVATSVAETWIVKQAGAGFVVSSTEEFAQAIVHLLRDDRLRALLSENAILFAKDYDWDILARRYENEIFSSLQEGC